MTVKNKQTCLSTSHKPFLLSYVQWTVVCVPLIFEITSQASLGGEGKDFGGKDLFFSLATFPLFKAGLLFTMISLVPINILLHTRLQRTIRGCSPSYWSYLRSVPSFQMLKKLLMNSQLSLLTSNWMGLEIEPLATLISCRKRTSPSPPKCNLFSSFH